MYEILAVGLSSLSISIALLAMHSTSKNFEIIEDLQQQCSIQQERLNLLAKRRSK